MIVLLVIGGLYNLAFAAFHIDGWRRLGLMRDLRFLTPQTINFVNLLNVGMSFFLALMGYVCLAQERELLETSLGQVILIGLTIFWTGRAILQMRYFGWRGRMQFLWVALFIFGALLFAIPTLAACNLITVN